jgi:hypothetical protein
LFELDTAYNYQPGKKGRYLINRNKRLIIAGLLFVEKPTLHRLHDETVDLVPIDMV